MAELEPVALALALVLVLVLVSVLLGPIGRSELKNEGKRPSEVLVLLLLLADADEDAEEVAVGITADE